MDFSSFLLLAQDPVGIGEALGQAQDVQKVLGIICGVLLLAVGGLWTYHVKREKHHEARYDGRVEEVFKLFKRVERALTQLAGLGDSRDEE